MKQKSPFREGLRDGLPICVGYIPISFAFGMMARQSGLPVWAAVLISLSNFTSAGQIAGTNLILAGGAYVEIAVTTFVINIRYMLMSLSLTQKLDSGMSRLKRAFFSFFNTDELFAVAMQQKTPITGSYLAGLMLLPYLSWSGSTLLGATAADLLPQAVRSALGIAIYGMFLAIFIPPSRKVKPIFYTVLISAGISCLFSAIPMLRDISSGWVIIICAVVASALMALRYPVDEEEPAGEDSGTIKPERLEE